MKILRIEVRPLTVPLVEPFVIASGRMDSTRAAIVVARLMDERSGAVARGIGEAAALPPVTASDQPDLLRHIARANMSLAGQSFAGHSQLEAMLDDVLGRDPVARAGVEVAVLDAWARLEKLPAHAIMGEVPQKPARVNGEFSLVTDVTIPISDPAHMAVTARAWAARGFTTFKVKVGKDVDDDARAIEQIVAAVPQCTLRLDGNAGLASGDAMSLIGVCRSVDATLECFEQPCAADDLEGMARVTVLAGCPVVADESVKTLSDLEQVIAAKAATGVNLKLVKHGGPIAAGRIGRAAKRAGMKVMVGAMVETRLGLAAMAHLTRALASCDGIGGDFVDLDTALLLKWDPFVGAYEMDGAKLTLIDDVGLGVSEAPPMA